MTGSPLSSGTIVSGRTVTGRAAPAAAGIGSDELARQAGLRARVVSNMFHFAQMTDLLILEFGKSWFETGEIHLNYLAPLYDGDQLTPKFQRLPEKDEGERAVLRIWCENQRGEVLASGEASVRRVTGK